MALTKSTMLKLGSTAPNFSLPDPSGEMHSLSDCTDAPAMLVMFICNHCPYVKHIKKSIAEFTKKYQKRGVAIVAINSNDFSAYSDDNPDKMQDDIKAFGYTFPYLIDETQDIAKAYRAACTPDFFLFDADRKLVYRGQFDDSRPGNDVPIKGADLEAAIEANLKGLPIEADQKPSIGCNIKWKPDNEPDYFL